MADNKHKGLAGDSKFAASRGQSTPTAVAQEPAYAIAVGCPPARSGSRLQQILIVIRK